MPSIVCEYKGKEYPSIKALAQATNHTASYISKCLYTCKTQEEFEKKVDQKIHSRLYKGKWYKTRDLLKLCKVSEDNFYRRIEAGWSVEEAVDTPFLGRGGVRAKREH